jgi:hypothetical protein
MKKAAVHRLLPSQVLIWVSLVILICPTAARAATLHSAVVFDFELIDTSLENEISGPRADEQSRLRRLAPRLRDLIAADGRFTVVPLDEASGANAARINLHSCNGCDADIAKRLGAEFSVIGIVQKVSNLILNLTLVVRDAGSGSIRHTISVDMRGNTEDTWSRALNDATRRLLAEM